MPLPAAPTGKFLTPWMAFPFYANSLQHIKIFVNGRLKITSKQASIMRKLRALWRVPGPAHPPLPGSRGASDGPGS